MTQLRSTIYHLPQPSLLLPIYTSSSLTQPTQNKSTVSTALVSGKVWGSSSLPARFFSPGNPSRSSFLSRTCILSFHFICHVFCSTIRFYRQHNVVSYSDHLHTSRMAS